MLLLLLYRIAGKKSMLAHKFADAYIRSRPALSSRVTVSSRMPSRSRSQPVRDFHWSFLRLKLRHRVLLLASRYLPSRAGNAPKVVANQITVSRFFFATGGLDLATGGFKIVRGASLRCVLQALLCI